MNLCTLAMASCALVLPGCAFAATMGTLAPHDVASSKNGQPGEQWIADPRTNCIAGDPGYQPGDTISWQGGCKRNGMIFGSGTLTFLNNGRVVETITGDFTDGLPKSGHVAATWSDGTKYEGEQLGGMFNGKGKFVSADGEAHDGEWKMGVFLSGKASVVWASGDRYDGEWKNGKPDGEGVETWADGRRYEGQFRDGAPVSNTEASATSATSAPAVSSVGSATAQATTNATSPPPIAAQPTIQNATFVAPATPPLTRVEARPKQALASGSGNEVPNPALPLRTFLGTELVAVDGATLELALTDDGFGRTLVLPDGNSQETEFAFANGPVGTVSDGEKAIGVFRARESELDIDYADGATESVTEAGGGLVDHATSADNRAMCTSWYPKGHAFSSGEKQAAVQEYASRLGVSVGAPAGKQRAHDVHSACGGAFIASGGQQKSVDTDSADHNIGAPAAQPRASDQRAASDARPPVQRVASPDESVAIRTSAVHLIDASPAHLEQASYAPGAPSAAIADARAEANIPSPQPGASNCLTVTSNGEYWGFQNSCGKSVQFAYCEMSDVNPLTSCKHTSVSGSVAANGFSALVSDRSLGEKNAEHEFRWMACDGGAGEVVPHLDKLDPPSGRCERATAPAE